MTERELEILRFNKVEVSEEESGDKAYHYYTHTVVPGLELISNSSDEVTDDKWFVEFFNTEIPVRFYDMSKVLGLINLLTKSIVNEQ
jgi:hypothetical protein